MTVQNEARRLRLGILVADTRTKLTAPLSYAERVEFVFGNRKGEWLTVVIIGSRVLSMIENGVSVTDPTYGSASEVLEAASHKVALWLRSGEEAPDA